MWTDRDLLTFLLGVSVMGMNIDARAQCTANAGAATYTICAGGPFTLSGSAGGGQAPYDMVWTPATGLSDPNIADPVCTANSDITYTLTVTDANGCVASDVVSLTMLPDADATITSSNAAYTVFNGSPTFYRCTPNATALFAFDFGGAAQPGSTHTINWGDGTPVDVFSGPGWPSQSHTYPQGIHTINYTLTQTNGCNDTRVYRVFVGTNPAGALVNPGSTTGCGPITLTFPIVGWNTNTPGTIYTINFNDGTAPVIYTHPPPGSITHTFSVGSCGTTSTDGVNTYQNSFSANMLVENPCGTSGSTILPIVVSLAGQADFTISPNDTACVASTITFSSTSTGNEVLGNSCDVTPALLWSITPATGWSAVSGTLGNDNGFGIGNYDPGSWSTGSSVLGVNFAQAGTYTISIVAGNACGGDTLSRTICIEEPPIPAFTLSATTGCVPLNATSINSTTSPNSCLTTYLWTMSGSAAACATGPASSSSSTASQPAFLFDQPGTYTVQLRAINSCNVPPISQVVTVNAAPQVSVSPLSGICAGQCVSPTASVQDCGAPVTLLWTFPGGAPASSGNQVPGAICFANAGSPTVSLTATNACGSATSNANLAIGTAPTVPTVSSNSPVCQGQTISLTAMGAPGVNYIWRDPSGTIIANTAAHTIPGASASNAGTYTVVAVSNGCESAPASVTVVVTPAPLVTVTPSSAAVCNGQSTTFTANGAGNYQWFIGATLVGSGPNFTTSPAVTTTYTVSGNVGGCPGSATVTVTVYQPTPLDPGVPPTFCDQSIPVALQGASPAGGAWSGPNVTATGVFTPVPGDLGVVVLTYTYVNGNGCQSTATLPVTVQSVPEFADAGTDTILCQGAVPVDLFEAPPGGTWVGAGPGGSYTPASTGTFTLTYNYGSGTCATSDQVNVQVVPSTALTVPLDLERCVDAPPVLLTATPVGGTWTGIGVNGPPWEFDPAVAGLGGNVLTYTYTNGANCVSTAQFTATVNPLPVLNIGGDITLCDQPIAYQLGGDPVGGDWSSTWIPIAPDASITPAGVGSDVLTYTYTDANGCTNSASIQLDIVPVVVPAFAGNDTSVCVNSGDVALTGTPVGGTWTGAQVALDGTFNTSLPGTYTVTYSVGSGTCLLIDQVTIAVEALPSITTGGDLDVCLDGGMQPLSATPAGGIWSGVGVDAVTDSFDPLVAGLGVHNISYAYTDPITGCANSAGVTASVNMVPVASFTHGPVACSGVPMSFTNTSSGASSSEWDLGDGTTLNTSDAVHSYLNTGTFTVRLVVGTGAGCTDTIYSTIAVHDVPVADAVLDVEVGCGPLEVTFGQASVGDGLTYAWDMGGLGASLDTIPAPFIFPVDPVDAVVYPVSLTVTNTCGSDTEVVPVTVLPAPTASFGPNVNLHCAYADVPFGNASYGLPDGFQWDFGDGTTSTSSDPAVIHVYAVDEPVTTFFTVTLIATNSCGSDTAQQVIGVVPNEVTAFFNTDPVVGCGPLTVDLTNFSAGDTALYWDLGDGNGSIAEDLSHTFVDAGTYSITLSAFGCGFDTYTTEITVLPYPEVSFIAAPLDVCAGEEITFANTTSGTNGLLWAFGDGASSTLSAPVHAYGSSGSYTVVLTATDALSGCPASESMQVVVNATPVAAFTADPDNGCIALEVQFQNNSTNAQFHQWDLGDGNTSGAFAPVHTYTDAGTYVVTLVAENLNGCTDTLSIPVVAHPLPTSAFSLSQEESCYVPVTIQTSNTTTGAVSYTWSFGEGTTSILNQPSITYDAVGTYVIGLTATNQYGCEDQHFEAFTVHPTPVAVFTADPIPGCVGYPIAFANLSVNADSYRWNFGDGEQSTVPAPLHVYDQPGDYTVSLIANASTTCSDTLVLIDGVVVNPTPVAAFTSDTLVSVLNAVRFSNLSTGAVSYVWDFNDGTTDMEADPIHVFPADGGTYAVTLIAINAFGCPDTVRTFVGVAADPLIFAPNAFTPNTDGRNDDFLPVLNGFVGWNFTLLVFDRWGKVVFQSNDRDAGWDGRVNGREPVIDTYVWKVLLERDGDARDFVGHVSLID